MANDRAIEMFVGGLVLDPNSQAPVVVLKDESGNVCLPIWIGPAEATSIASAIKQVPMARPLTHDLMMEIINGLQAKVERIMITELKDSTYFAELVITFGDKALIYDARPSDAIALAIRASAPIYVNQTVLEQAKISFERKDVDGVTSETNDSSNTAGDADADAAETEAVTEEAPESGSKFGADFNALSKERWTEVLDDLDPDDFKYKM